VAPLSAKLQIEPGVAVSVLRLPAGVELELPGDCVSTSDPDVADAVIAFVRDRGELDAYGGPAISAAARDALAWIAYPKAGQLDTDLNRDLLAAAARERGIRPVRQVAIDDVWSALRFRPAAGP
jgi:hypothetical protein